MARLNHRMHILLANLAPIPVFAYGGTERVVWDLGLALAEMGHRVTYLVPEGSVCPFADVIPIRKEISWENQIPTSVDIAHFHFDPRQPLACPHVVTEHTNNKENPPLPLNTIFVSENHALRYGSSKFVRNGLNWANYGQPKWTAARKNFHFLGKAAWRVKNVQGAIDVARKAGIEMDVLGGTRLNIKRGFRFTWSRNIHFHGMVGGSDKFNLLNQSRGLIFPVRWHEPFGLAVIESMYFGAPVFATPYGAIPELVPSECGVLSNDGQELVDAILYNKFDPEACHMHVVNNFGHMRMANDYLSVYRQVLAGATLHSTPPQRIGEFRHLPWKSP